MTLIIGVVTHQFVALLSDRRVTVPGARGNPPTYRDNECKTVIMNGTHILGFAGLGSVGHSRQRMEFWLFDQYQDCLTKDSLKKWPERLSDRFGRACEAINFRGEHHFLAPGYAEAEDGTLTAEIISIGNDVYPNSFDITHSALRSEQALMSCIAGIDLPTEVQAEWKRSCAQVAQEKPLNMKAMMDLMVGLWAHMADQNSMVGRTAMITSLPKAAVPALAGCIPFGPPSPEQVLSEEVSLSLDLDPRGELSTTFFLPARIVEGMMMGGGEVTTSAPDNSSFERETAIRFGDLRPESDYERRLAQGLDRIKGDQ